MNELRFGRREQAFTVLFGLLASALVFGLGGGDRVLQACAAVLLLVSLGCGAVRPDGVDGPSSRRFFRWMAYMVVPTALCASLVVTTRVLPHYLYFVALYWTMTTWVFNLAVFRSRFLRYFLTGYLLVALALGFAVGERDGFARGTMLMLTGMSVFILLFQRRVMSELETAVDESVAAAARARMLDAATGLPNRHAFLQSTHRLLQLQRAACELVPGELQGDPARQRRVDELHLGEVHGHAQVGVPGVVPLP